MRNYGTVALKACCTILLIKTLNAIYNHSTEVHTIEYYHRNTARRQNINRYYFKFTVVAASSWKR